MLPALAMMCKWRRGKLVSGHLPLTLLPVCAIVAMVTVDRHGAIPERSSLFLRVPVSPRLPNGSFNRDE